MTDDNKAATAPYISFRTFLNLLDKLHSGGIPQHIDRHYWGGFLAGSTGQQVMAALRFLGLIDSDTNEPTPTLERLVDPTQRKATLAELLDKQYAGLTESGVDLSRTTPGRLEQTFGSLYKVEGETRRKAVTFFVHAAKFAEIPLSSQITAKTRQRRAASTSASRMHPKSGQLTPPPAGVRGRQPAKEQEIASQDTGSYAILHAFLRQLPPDGRWKSERRKRWLAALQANVDFLVAVEDEGEDEQYDAYEDQEEEETTE